MTDLNVPDEVLDENSDILGATNSNGIIIINAKKHEHFGYALMTFIHEWYHYMRPDWTEEMVQKAEDSTMIQLFENEMKNE